MGELMLKFSNLKDKIISFIYGAKYFDIKRSDFENIKQAQIFVNELIRLNEDAVERYNELQNYCNQESYNGVTAYFYTNKIYDVLDLKNLTFDNAMSYIDSLMNKEFYNIEDAIKVLKPMAVLKLREHGISKTEEEINLDDIFNQHLFFEESQDEYYAKIKNNFILRNIEPKTTFDKAFYKYYNGYIMQDIYNGFYSVFETIYHYVEYNEDQVESVTTFSDFPLSTKTLPWMKNINTGSVYSVPKEYIDKIFNAVESARQNLIVQNIKLDRSLKNDSTNTRLVEDKILENETKLDYIKIFEYNANYIKDRVTITNRTRTLEDYKKVLLSATDLATLVEYSLDIEESREFAVEIINYFAVEKETVPAIFILSDYIRGYIDLEKVSVYNTDNKQLTTEEISVLIGEQNNECME